MAKIKFKKNFRNFLAIALAILVGAGAIFGIVKLTEKFTSETKKITPSYQVGGIDVSGKGNDSKDSIVTKEAFECQGLKITPEFGANIEYQVFFYGVDDMYCGSTEVMEDTYRFEDTAFVKTARVVIYPQSNEDNEDVEVKCYQVRSYAKLLTIEVNRKQDFKFNGYEKIDYILYATDKAFTHAEENNVGSAFSEPREYLGYDVVSFSVENKTNLLVSTVNLHEGLRYLFVDSNDIVVSTGAYTVDTISNIDIPLTAKTCYLSVSQNIDYLIFTK